MWLVAGSVVPLLLGSAACQQESVAPPGTEPEGSLDSGAQDSGESEADAGPATGRGYVMIDTEPGESAYVSAFLKKTDFPGLPIDTHGCYVVEDRLDPSRTGGLPGRRLQREPPPQCEVETGKAPPALIAASPPRGVEQDRAEADRDWTRDARRGARRMTRPRYGSVPIGSFAAPSAANASSSAAAQLILELTRLRPRTRSRLSRGRRPLSTRLPSASTVPGMV